MRKQESLPTFPHFTVLLLCCIATQCCIAADLPVFLYAIPTALPPIDAAHYCAQS